MGAYSAQAVVNSGSELLIFVPPAAHNDDLAHMMAENPTRCRGRWAPRRWAQLVIDLNRPGKTRVLTGSGLGQQMPESLLLQFH